MWFSFAGKKVSPTASSDKSTASRDDTNPDSPLINMSSEFNGQQGVSERTITLPNLHQSQVNTPVPTSGRQDSLQPLGQSPVSHTCSSPGSAIPTPDGNLSTLASQVSQPSSATHTDNTKEPATTLVWTTSFQAVMVRMGRFLSTPACLLTHSTTQSIELSVSASRQTRELLAVFSIEIFSFDIFRHA